MVRDGENTASQGIPPSLISTFPVKMKPEYGVPLMRCAISVSGEKSRKAIKMPQPNRRPTTEKLAK